MTPFRLISDNIASMETVDLDVLIVGGGVAGLAAALALPQDVGVGAIAKGGEDATNSYYAQGGVATVFDPDDDFQFHRQDTLEAGAGLCDEAAVDKLVGEGPARIEDLFRLGVRFDTEDGRIMLGQEGGHSRRRILHADGDRTGREMVRVMAQAVRSQSNRKLFRGCFAVDLAVENNVCFGAVACDMHTNRLFRVRSNITILATGGLGQLYRETSNPADATGDGVAMALRAGADVMDMEFVQFHPTSLYLAGAPRMLISEAVRGEGAYLLNAWGERFMERFDPRMELAVRDVVARAVMEESRRTGNVVLSLSHLDAKHVRGRFPFLTEYLARYGLDMAKDPIPVRPAAHFAMGGVRTDLSTRTAIERLLACGECACTGVHGANRLASNSILEGLVFGHQAGKTAESLLAQPMPPEPTGSPPTKAEYVNAAPLDLDDLRRSLTSLMWTQVGLLRHGAGLSRAEKLLDFWQSFADRSAPPTVDGFVIRNMLMVARMIAGSARMRTESRGAHARTDYPHTDSVAWNRHLIRRLS